MKLQTLILASALLLTSTGSAFSQGKSVIIGFKQKPGPNERAMVRGASGMIKRSFQLIPAMSVTLPEEEIEKLKKSGRIEYIEENWTYFTAGKPSAGVEYDNCWGVTRIHADDAHATGNRGTGMRIAVIDTGIDLLPNVHPDLVANYRGGYDFVSDDAFPDDRNDDGTDGTGHGTHVAGIVAAVSNGAGVIGVAPEAQIYAVRVLNGGGIGTLDDVIAGIDWAAANNVDVINMSIQGSYAWSLEQACNAAYAKGILLVAAGGNSPVGGQPVAYPAANDSVIAVTATDSQKKNPTAYFSPMGFELELAAPGVNILSTVLGGNYGGMSGTSQAAPHVAGAAALCLQTNTEDLDGDGVVDHRDARLKLQQTAKNLGSRGWDPTYGYGLVDAAAASQPTDSGGSGVVVDPFSISDQVKSITLAGSPHSIAISNFGLSSVDVDVLKDGVLKKKLSKTYQFRANGPQEVVLQLDATGNTYDVFFAPTGESGAYADVVVTKYE